MVVNVFDWDSEIFWDVPHLPQDLVLHTAAQAWRLVNNHEIQLLSDQERAESAWAIIVSLAREHFVQNPESNYIDFLQHPEFTKIRDLLVMWEDKNIDLRFDWFWKFLDKQGMWLFRPSYQYFTEAYKNASSDYFWVFKYPRNSPEYNTLRFSSKELQSAVQNNRVKFRKLQAA